MCGFAALIQTDGSAADPGVVRRMNDVIRHRGPDDSGLDCEGGVALGFRRLSILDLSQAGHQPMTTPDGRATIVFNGEIFNYRELRADLEERGHRFRSTGDTEVLLAAYREWGSDCCERLNGMWAFLVHDRERNLIFGSRDRYGIKPLYFHEGDGFVLFGSEIKSIVASGRWDRGPDWGVAAEFFLERQLGAGDAGERTFYDGIRQVLPGHWFELRLDGGWKRSRYWGFPDEGGAFDDPPEQFAGLFEDSVRLRLRSDVPVGVCLSGGLDSTSILCAMARQQSRAESAPAGGIEAFCYHARDFDERRYVDDTLAQTGAHLNRIDLAEAIPMDRFRRILWQHDQPVVSASALVGYELMQEAAAKGVKVVLNGQGADECLAGYPSYFLDYWHSLVAGGRLGRAWREVGRFAAAHDESAARHLYRAARSVGRLQLRRFAAYRGVAHRRALRAAADHRWYRGPLTGALSDATPPFRDRSLRDALLWSVSGDPLPLYLRQEDRNSMAHSVESRLPFLDYRLVELAFRLPDEWKLRGEWNKYILRESMRGRIPESVRSRVDKMGFPTQQRDWFRGPWYEPMQDLLAGRTSRERGIYHIENIRQDLERHHRGEIDVSHDVLFDVLQMEAWLACTEATSAGRE